MAPSSRAIRAGQAFFELFADDSRLIRGLRAAQKRLRNFGRSVTGIGTSLALAGTALAAPFAAATKIFSDTGDQLNKMSARTGIAVESLSALKFAAEQSGATLEQFEPAIRGMARAIFNLERGSADAVDAFDKLNLSFDDMNGLSPERQFLMIAEAIADLTDPTERAAVAMRVFGRSGTQILPLLGDINALVAEAERLGIVLSTEDAQAAADFADAMNRLKSQLRVVFFQIGSAVGGVLTDFLATTQNIGKVIIEWVTENKRLIAIIAAVGTAMVAGGLALIVFGQAAIGLAAILGITAASISAVAAVLSSVFSSPVALAVVAIGALAAAFVEWGMVADAVTGFVAERFGRLVPHVQRTIAAMGAALASGDVTAAANLLWASLRVLWVEGTSQLKAVWYDWTRSLRLAVIEAWFGIQQAFFTGITYVINAWDSMATSLREIWINVIGEAKDAWFKFARFVQDLAIDALPYSDDIKQQAKDDLDKAEAARRAADKRARDAATRQARADLERRQAVSRRVLEGINDELGAEFNAARENVSNEVNEGLQQAQRDLEEARKAWSNAVSAAESGALDAGAMAGETFQTSFEDILEQIDTVAEGLRVFGGFNASVVARQVGSTSQERTAKATEETAKNTKKIAERVAEPIRVA